MAITLSCDMRADCVEPVAYLDQRGFAYCAPHGLQRQQSEPCRKLRPHELRKLERGEQLARY